MNSQSWKITSLVRRLVVYRCDNKHSWIVLNRSPHRGPRQSIFPVRGAILNFQLCTHTHTHTHYSCVCPPCVICNDNDTTSARHLAMNYFRPSIRESCIIRPDNSRPNEFRMKNFVETAYSFVDRLYFPRFQRIFRLHKVCYVVRSK